MDVTSHLNKLANYIMMHSDIDKSKNIKICSQKYIYGKATYIPIYQISRMTIGTIPANSRYIDIMIVSGYCFFTVFSCCKSFLQANLTPQTCYKRLFYCYYCKQYLMINNYKIQSMNFIHKYKYILYLYLQSFFNIPEHE